MTEKSTNQPFKKRNRRGEGGERIQMCLPRRRFCKRSKASKQGGEKKTSHPFDPCKQRRIRDLKHLGYRLAKRASFLLFAPGQECDKLIGDYGKGIQIRTQVRLYIGRGSGHAFGAREAVGEEKRKRGGTIWAGTAR